MNDIDGVIHDLLVFGCTIFVGVSSLVMIGVGKPHKRD